MKPFAPSAILIFGSTLMVATAQQPGARPAPAPEPVAAQTVTTHSSIRGFSAGPNGVPRTLFLSNGDAVELGPRFGNLPAGELRKGQRVEVTGTSTQAASQRTIDALTLRVGSQTYTAMVARNAEPAGIAPRAGGPPQRPDNGGVGGPPPPPPPPPAGMPGAPRGRREGPPPPPPNGAPQPPSAAVGLRVPPPPASVGGSAVPLPPPAGNPPAAPQQ